MEISDYIRQIRDNCHTAIGDGMIFVHTNNKSEIVKFGGESILELSQEEHCINAKNGYFLICNKQTDKYYIIDKDKQIKKTIDTNCLSVPKFRNIIVYYDRKRNLVRIINYAGKLLYTFDSNFVNLFESASQISNDLVCLEFYPTFECDDFENYLYHKCVVVNIPNEKVILQGKWHGNFDENIISEVSYFEFPILLPKGDLGFVPAIKYTVVEPAYDDNDNVIYKQNVEFCDFCGNVIKRTEYSEVSNLQNGCCFDYYIVKKRIYNDCNDYLYGILDHKFDTILPCYFPRLINNIIKIDELHSSRLCCELDRFDKRFLAKKENGDTIRLPYMYYSCDNEYISNTNNKMLFAYKYDDKGRHCTGIINDKGEELLTAKYKSINRLCDNLYEAIGYDPIPFSQLLYIENNHIILRKQYITIEKDVERMGGSSYFRVRIQNDNLQLKLGLVDNKGIEVIPTIYDYVFYPSEKMVTYIRDGVAGWINLSDMSTHEYPKFSVINPFINGQSIVCVGENKVRSIPYKMSYPYISYLEPDDVYGKIIIQFTFDPHKEGIIDSNGKTIAEPIFDEIIRIKDTNNIFVVKRSQEFGAINNHGEIVIPIQYSWFYIDEDIDIDDCEKYKDIACVFHNKDKVDFYNSKAELIGSEDYEKYNRQRHSYEPDDQGYNERDTYYALGGDDYDEWRANGGILDDMMDGMGF